MVCEQRLYSSDGKPMSTIVDKFDNLDEVGELGVWCLVGFGVWWDLVFNGIWCLMGFGDDGV